MNTERAFTLIHNLDIPENKRYFWQQWATVVIDKKGNILDVIKHFGEPTLSLNNEHLNMYPNSIQFTVKAGEMFSDIKDFTRKIKESVELGNKY